MSDRIAGPRIAPPRRRWGDLSARAASGLVLVALALGTARVGGTVFVLAWLLGALAVNWEWQRLIGAPSLMARVALGSAALVLAAIRRTDQIEVVIIVLGAAGALALFAGEGRRLWAAAGMAYAGLLLLATLSLRASDPYGARAIIWLFATVWATDTFAYFGGRLMGGPKLWPRISPSKTWSGTLTGLAAGSAIGTFAAVRDLPEPAIVVPILLVTLAASVLSQAGDALESAIKRRFDVKDSSRLIPGHGGVMDRLDGFVAAAVFAFCFGLARSDVSSVAAGLFRWP